MSDLNPYESPKTEQPLKPAQIAKRSAGLALILLLTPLAMVIAVAVCCSAINIVPSGGIFAFAGPFVVLTALIYWATRLDRRGDARGEEWRRKTLLTIPYVAGATVAGIVMMGAMTLAFWNSLDDPTLNQLLTVVGWSFFFVPPSITLIVKLWLAWRSSR
jgi:hypothetical protein